MKSFDSFCARLRLLTVVSSISLLTTFLLPVSAAIPRYKCTILDDTVGGAFIEARALNNKGQVVGTVIGQLGVRHKLAPGAPEIWHGFLWSEGQFTDLGVLPNSVASDASSINDHGQIVGTSG